MVPQNEKEKKKKKRKATTETVLGRNLAVYCAPLLACLDAIKGTCVYHTWELHYQE